MKLTDDMKAYIDHNIYDLILKIKESPRSREFEISDTWEYFYTRMAYKTVEFKEELDYQIWKNKQQEDEIEELQNYILELREVNKNEIIR